MKHKKMIITLCVIVALGIIVLIVLSHPKFGKLPSGERLERVENSPNYRQGQFHNQIPTPQIVSDKGMLATMWDFLFEKRERNRPESPMLTIKSDLRNLSINDNVMVWFGHSSYFLQIKGVKILADPVFYDASPFSFINRPFDGTDVFKPEDMPDIDLLLITHDHWDHLDYRTVSQLRQRVKSVVCPLGVGAHLERWMYSQSQIVELDWWGRFVVNDSMVVTSTPARHFSGRSLTRNKTLWSGYMIESDTQNLYISGDSGYGPHYKEIRSRFPAIDLAILENGQYNEQWRYIHHLPTDLQKAIEELTPLKIHTGHNSKYALSPHPYDEPMNIMTEYAKGRDFELLLPVIGEIVYL